jgi:hypothetical protein
LANDFVDSFPNPFDYYVVSHDLVLED